MDLLGFTVGFVILSFLFESWLDYRQYKRTFMSQPSQTEGLMGKEEYEKSQLYARTKFAFGLATDWLSLVKEVCFLLFLVYPLGWQWSGELLNSYLSSSSSSPASSSDSSSSSPASSSSSQMFQSLIFAFLFSLIDTVYAIPFDYYKTFVIEEKFGFNKTTQLTFWTDLLKGLLLNIVIGGPIMVCVLWVLETFGGPSVWLYLWPVLFGIILIFIAIKPLVIDPLFNKYEALPEGELQTRINGLAAKLHFPLTKIFVVDGSLRSSHSNAYFYGLFKNKRIVLFDTLINQMSPDEVEAVLGHELGHWYHSHTLINLLISQVHLGFFLFFSSTMIYNPEVYESFGFHGVRAPMIGLMLFSYLVSPLNHVLSFLINFLTRANEYQADRFAASHGYAPHLCRALIKLFKENLGNINIDPLYSLYHHTHPTLVERLNRLGYFEQKKQQ